MKLQSKAVLVQLNMSSWTARKYDKKVTEEVSNSYNTIAEAGRYNKSLLPLNDYLGHIVTLSNTIRAEFYQNTLPWGINGTHILPSKNYMSFMNSFRSHKAERERLVDTFVDAYPQLKLDAQRLLPNGLYKEEDYPLVDTLKDRFKMDIVVSPVPPTDFRCEDLSQQELDDIHQEVTARVTDASSTAMKEAWQRLYDLVKHTSDKLNDPSGTFRDSLVGNLVSICEVLPRLNFTDDPNLEAMRKEVEVLLASQNPEALRCDWDLRDVKAKEAKDISNKMSVFMEGL